MGLDSFDESMLSFRSAVLLCHGFESVLALCGTLWFWTSESETKSQIDPASTQSLAPPRAFELAPPPLGELGQCLCLHASRSG